MKKMKRWLALVLAIALVSTNAIYQLGTHMSASESSQDTSVSEEQPQQEEQAADSQTQDTTEHTDSGQASVQEVTPDQSATATTQQAADVQQAADAQQTEAAQTDVAKTIAVKIQKSDVDGGTVKVVNADGSKSDVTYDGNNQYAKEVTEGESFGFEVTAKDGYQVEQVTDQNGTAIQPASVNGNVSTYNVTDIRSEKVFSVTYNKVETQTEEKKDEDDKTEDANQDESPIAVQAAQGYIRIYGNDTVYIDRSITLSAFLSGAEGTVEWSSSDPSVATVDQNGKVTGIKKGTVTIYAALGTALIASKQITVKRDESNGQYVYLYTKVTGDTTGLVLNKDGWYTIGKLWVANMPSAAYSRYPNGKHYNSGTEWNAVQSALANPNNFERYGSNTTIEMSSINWSNYGLIIADGATNYVGSGRQWHLDGLSNVTSYGSVTINHYLEGTTQKLADSQTINAEENTVINGANYKKTITGYTYTSANPERYKIVKKTTGVINLYYSKGSFGYTVNYLDKDTGEAIHSAKKWIRRFWTGNNRECN